MDNSTNKKPFIPVKAKEAQVKKLESHQDGYLYFTTDSKKIYMAHDKELLTMGGNSSVYYGKRTMADEEIYGDLTEFDFLGYVKDLEDNVLYPQVDDLILNEPDGGFYRIIESTDRQIIGKRIAVSGTGGGGGGTGGGGGSTSKGELAVQAIGKRNVTILRSDSFSARYKVIVKDAEGNEIGDAVSGVWKVNGQEVARPNNILPNKENSFSLDNYLQAGKVNTVSLTVEASLDNGVTFNKAAMTWNVEVINLDLQWDFVYSTNTYINGDSFSVSWIPKGGIDCQTHLTFYNQSGEVILKEVVDIPASKTNERNTLTLSTKDKQDNLIFSYGVYTCEIYVTAVVNDELKSTKTIRNELTFIADGSTDLLTVPFYQTECRQYDTLSIPFMIYNPNKEKCLVKFYIKDNATGNFGEPIGQDEYEQGLQYWPYTVTNSGLVTLKIEAENQSVYKDIDINVAELDIDVDEVPGYVFSLKAANFSTNEQLRNWKIGNEIGLTFSDNFDWNTGGLKFRTLENGAVEKYIRIPVGMRMTVNYAPYAADNNIVGNGRDLKICFKATNCYDYNAAVGTCYEAKSRLGLEMTAQQAVFHIGTGASTNTQYCENSYIELEHEIYPKEDPDVTHKNPDRFLFFWIDGVPVGVQVYPDNISLKQSESQNLTFGSDECDVEIYTVKVYNRSLTENEHLRNFIADAPTPQEMLARYDRNDILVNGQIDPEKLVQKNPKCRAYVYEIPRMTMHKDDKVGGCNYTELYGDNNTFANPYYKAINTGDGAKIRVQGTSSAAYGVAAFNLRTEFQEGLTKQGKDEVVNWKVSDNAIPIDYTCTKVNVASCENANNVVNQEWYNRFQPYYDTNRRKGGRDTMEFNSGVVFIKDLNTKTNFIGEDGAAKEDLYKEVNVFSDVEGYVESPYYRQYAIGNMGNDKKNIEVFHDTTNPLACCVENADNQLALQHMTEHVEPSTSSVKSRLWEILDDQGNKVKPYEFRYPDGDETLEQRNAFERLVNWMADNNPMAATNEPIEPITFGAYKFKGQDNPASGVSLKDEEVNNVYDYDKETDTWTLINLSTTEFTTDSYGYRIAKMLHECEDYLVMDSIVFHYLFIQRHTMVDNVAKNTFWSSEDLLHWDLTKDYDNDTADGNNNSGNLVYGYGIEIMDQEVIEGISVSIFNAPDSVWMRFIHGIPAAQKALYKKIFDKSSEAWGTKEYMKEFEKHQDIIPERCWIQNYFHHYIRPRRIGLDADGKFLKRLEGGKKKHQRNQYETYQSFYIDSKYVTGNNFQDTGSMDLRLNYDASKEWDTDNKIPLTYYIDCYGSAKVGGKIHQSGRMKRGDVYNYPIGQELANPKDATCYIYGANMIQSVSELADVLPQYVGVNPAKKLRSIAIGSNEPGFSNPFLNELGMSTNTMLEYIDVRNVGQSAGLSLDIPNATQLKTLLMSGNNVNSLTLPANGILETLELNQKLGSIVASNLTKITDFSVDDGYEQYLSSVKVSNCPALDEYTYKFALSETDFVKTYSITDFNWEITNKADLVEEDGKIVDIIALKHLAEGTAINSNRATDLIGTITIKVENCKVDEYALYEKYSTIFPNVMIEYDTSEGKVTLDPPAAKIIFYTSQDNDTIYYQVKGKKDGTQSLTYLTSVEGPLGIAMIEPSKASTSEFSYYFLGWKDKATNDFISLETKVTNNLELYPVFEESPRIYTIEFYNHVNELLPEYTLDRTWNDVYSVPGYLYRDDSNLPDDKTWTLIGWAETNYGDNTNENNLITSKETLYAKGNKKFYAHFKQQDVRETSSDIHLFSFNNSTKTISIKEEYKHYSGKLTIPAKFNGEDVLVVGDFSNMPGLTHVYFQNGSVCTTIGTAAFYWSGHQDTTNFVKIELPATINKIEASAFYHCCKLQDLGEHFNKVTYIGESAFSGNSGDGFDTWQNMALVFNELPSGLTYMGSHAFFNCVNIVVTVIPDGITEIAPQVFVNCVKVALSDFNQVKRIDTYALLNVANTTISHIDIRNVTYMNRESVENAYKNLQTVTFDSRNISLDTLAECFIGYPSISFADLNG